MSMTRAHVGAAADASSGSPECWLQIQELHKAYGPVQAVKGVDLDVARGEFVTLLGASGSGKTTTLMIVAGFEAATSGQVHLNGRDITGLPAHKRGLGVVFQGYALFPHMTVGDNVAYPLRMRGIAKKEQVARTQAALEQVDLGNLVGRYPRQLSGGQQQRVALARALVFNPPLLLMDEPLGALDKSLRGRMQAEIRRIHRESGTTVLFVTHDQEEAMQLSDRIAVMADGKIIQVGTPEEVYARPASRFVAEFLGDMNIIPTRSVSTTAGPGLAVTATLEDGTQVRAVSTTTAHAGQPLSIAIRPEKLKVQGSSQTTDEHSWLPASVIDRTFLGGQVRYLCRSRAGDELTFSEPADAVPRAVGHDVTLGWSLADAVAFVD